MTKDTLESLIQQLTQGSDEQAEAAALAIAALGEAALPALTRLSTSQVVDERWWALRCLAGMDGPGVTPLLIAGLRDPEVEVRQCAALGLSHNPDPAAIPDLVTALHLEDPMLRRLAAEALVAIGEPAVPALIETLAGGQDLARIEAARGLAMSDDPRAVPALFEALDDPSALIEYWADLGLERRGIGMYFFRP